MASPCAVQLKCTTSPTEQVAYLIKEQVYKWEITYKLTKLFVAQVVMILNNFSSYMNEAVELIYMYIQIIPTFKSHILTDPALHPDASRAADSENSRQLIGAE